MLYCLCKLHYCRMQCVTIMNSHSLFHKIVYFTHYKLECDFVWLFNDMAFIMLHTSFIFSQNPMKFSSLVRKLLFSGIWANGFCTRAEHAAITVGLRAQ